MEIALLLIFLALLIIVPIILLIAGIVFLCNTDDQVKRKGRNFMLAGVLLILIEILIGYSLCSGLTFH